jgi:hypothetical protein
MQERQTSSNVANVPTLLAIREVCAPSLFVFVYEVVGTASNNLRSTRSHVWYQFAVLVYVPAEGRNVPLWRWVHTWRDVLEESAEPAVIAHTQDVTPPPRKVDASLPNMKVSCN